MNSDNHHQSGPGPSLRWLMQVVWPAFLGAIVAIGVFFSAVDPLDLSIAGIPPSDSREAAYTIGFLVFWALFVLSGSMTYFLVTTERRRR